MVLLLLIRKVKPSGQDLNWRFDDERIEEEAPIVQDAEALTISDSNRIRIAAAWEALSVNSRRPYQGEPARSMAQREGGISLDNLSDELMAVYIACLGGRRGQLWEFQG